MDEGIRPDPARPLVILTGAGISRESGLETFRDKDGIWAKVNLAEVATPEAFAANPARVHEFYNHRRRALLSAEVAPNAAHLALARLEKAWPGGVILITQNIDDLHERAGSERLIHMHGELLKARCGQCGDVLEWLHDLETATPCPSCGQLGGLRPHVVWFGEIPLHMEAIMDHLAVCGMFISIGTSGSVYPAAGFAELVRERGGVETVEINLEPSEGAVSFTHARYGPAGREVPAFVDELLAGLAQ